MGGFGWLKNVLIKPEFSTTLLRNFWLVLEIGQITLFNRLKCRRLNLYRKLIGWFQSHPWLQYHREKRAAFCSICTEFPQPRDNSPFVFGPLAQGFRNWKKGVEQMAGHARSENHKSAEKSSKRERRIPDIGCMLDDQTKELQKKRRQGIVAHLQTMETLLRQGLPIRGHNDLDSNIRHLNKDKAIKNDGLKLFLQVNLYMLHDILTK